MPFMTNILTQLRERHGYTQEKLAEMIGVSRQHLAKVERDEAELKLSQAQKCAEIFDISIDALSLGQLPEEESMIKATGAGSKKEQTGRDPRPQISVNPENVQKFKEVLLYILERVGARPNVGKTVLCKLMYFIDFDFYEKYEEQLVGATYRKEAYGPLPGEFTQVVAQMKKDGEIQEVPGKYFDKEQIKYLPLRKPNLRLLKAHEIEMIDDVINRHAGKSATEISEFSHLDIPWRVVDMHEELEYEAVFYRNDEFSVRDEEDEL